MSESPDTRVNRNFILQQGLNLPAGGSCNIVASAYLFQPRVVGSVVLIGSLLQSAPLFFVLSAFLWWSALLPRANPFDAFYNATFGRRKGAARLEPAPVPRRFSQGLAATFALAAGILIIAEANVASRVVEAIFLVAAASISLGRLCLGSFVFYLLTGKGQFAVDTLPWGSGWPTSAGDSNPATNKTPH